MRTSSMPMSRCVDPADATAGSRPRPPAPAGDGWRARLAAATAPVVASVEPRAAAAAEWLFERRLHVLIVAATRGHHRDDRRGRGAHLVRRRPGARRRGGDRRRDPATDLRRPGFGEHVRADPAESRPRSSPATPSPGHADAVARRPDVADAEDPTTSRPRTRPSRRRPRTPTTVPCRPGRRTSPTSPQAGPDRGSPARRTAPTARHRLVVAHDADAACRRSASSHSGFIRRSDSRDRLG